MSERGWRVVEGALLATALGLGVACFVVAVRCVR